MARLKSCIKCGKIHSTDYKCSYASIKKKKDNVERSEEDRLRGLQVWKNKRKQINERDNYMCQVCSRKLYKTYGKQYNSDTINVHHIIPIIESKELWLEDSNLLCLCKFHHKMAEDNKIPRSVLRDIAKKQELKYTPWV